LALNAVPGDDHGAAQTVRLDLADSERLRSTDPDRQTWLELISHVTCYNIFLSQ